MLRGIQEPGTERHRVMVVVRMSKVMVAMLCCGSKDASQMGGAIVVRGEGKDKERVRLRGFVCVCVCVCVQTFTSETHFFDVGVVHFWSISDI